MVHGIRIGDRITFRAAVRGRNRTETRVVVGHTGRAASPTSLPTVRFNGWPEFIIRAHEIRAVNGAPVGD